MFNGKLWTVFLGHSSYSSHAMDIQDLSADDQKTVISIDSKCKEAVEFEDGTILELGYAPVYRRVFRMLGNMCLVVALTS